MTGKVGDVVAGETRSLWMFRCLAAVMCCGTLLWSGCGGARRPHDAAPTLHSIPVQGRQKALSAVYPLAEDVRPEQGHVEIYFQGLGRRRVGRAWVTTMRLQVSVFNDTDRPLSFDTLESHVVDNRGWILHCSRAMRDGRPAETFETVLPHSHAQFDLFFDLPADYPLEHVENFRVYWRWKLGDEKCARSTLFVRQPLKEVGYRGRDGRFHPYVYFMAVKDR